MQRQNSNDSARRIGDVLEDVIQGQSVKPRPLGTDGLRTGLRAVDDVLGDLPYCETVGVVGHWEVVTDTLLTIARNAASMGASVLYCTKRDASEAVIALASAISCVPFVSLLGGTYSEGEAKALDRAIGEIRDWNMRFIEFDDCPKDALANLHRAITQTVGLDGAPSDRPRLVVIDSFLEAYLQEWHGAAFVDALEELNEIAAQSRATLLFGFAGELLVDGFSLDSSLRYLIYATIELEKLHQCERVLQAGLTIRGERFIRGESLLAWDPESCYVDDMVALSSESEDGCTRTAVGSHGPDNWLRPLFPGERLMRHEIMQTAMPFTERTREASVATRDEQWRLLKNWAYRGCPDVALELRDFEAFVAYEIGFEKEADSSYRSKGLCKILHDRAMARASCSDELKTQLLLALLSAFSFMDERVNGGEGERPAYRLCG